jgi:NADPH2:quinone reductase
MRAIAIPSFGPAEVLTVMELDPPAPGPGQVAVRVARAGINYAEVLFRQGLVDVPLPFVPGIEVAGHVAALGQGVSGLSAGDPVAALTIVDGGGYGEVAVTDARLVAPLPAPAGPADLVSAAAAASNSTTALLALEEVAGLRAGETVLVEAAAGGLGSQVGQAARLLGAGLVVGVVGSAGKAAAAKTMGYDQVILREELASSWPGLTGGRGFDVAVDPVGGASRRRCFATLATGGRLLAIGNASGADDEPFGASELWLASQSVLGFNLRAAAQHQPERVGAALRRAVDAVLHGAMKVAVEVIGPGEVIEAHRRIERGSTTGKLVLALR